MSKLNQDHYWRKHNEVLLAPTHGPVKRNTCDIRTVDVLTDIGNLISLSYRFQTSPLGGLRTYFSDFTWHHHEPQGHDGEKWWLGKVIHNADYIWLVKPFALQYAFTEGLVTARRKVASKPWRLCVCSNKGEEGANQYVEDQWHFQTIEKAEALLIDAPDESWATTPYTVHHGRLTSTNLHPFR